MLLPMTQPTDKPDRTRLNVAVDPELHKDLRRLSAETGEPFTVLVPRLLRQAVKQEKERLGMA